MSIVKKLDEARKREGDHPDKIVARINAPARVFIDPEQMVNWSVVQPDWSNLELQALSRMARQDQQIITRMFRSQRNEVFEQMYGRNRNGPR